MAVAGILICAVLFQNVIMASGDIYAAVTELEELVYIEHRLINVTKEYLRDERRKLAGLRQFAEAAEKAADLSSGDPLEYIANPINSYLLLKRFTWGWKELSSLLDFSDDRLKDIDTILKVNKKFMPTYDEDFIGAAAGLFRLQETYSIAARDMAEGVIKGVKRAALKLTAEDCYELGVLGYKNHKYERMLEWLQEAERLMHHKNEDRVGKLDRNGLFEHISWAYFMSGDVEEALKFGEKFLEHNATDATMLNNVKYYKSILRMDAERRRIFESPFQFDFKQDLVNNKDFYNSTYARACRGDFLDNVTLPKNISNLRCYYKRNIPRLILKPLKVECVHDNPEIYLIRELLNDREIHLIQEQSKPLLKMAKVYSSLSGNLMSANYRVSKSAWLFYDLIMPRLHHRFRMIDRRCQDVTDLTINTAEELQVVNYGIGGQYEFHRDHGDVGAPLDKHKWGNRIATLLFYLSDVEAGGETVFTKTGISLKPNKGDGAFWYNLHRNGTGNWLTEHASCPVISGSKWVMNKWFHIKGNEFNRRCSLNKDE